MTDYSKYSVFIFGAGGRQTLPVCKGFYALGCKVTNYCFSKLDTGALTKYKSERIVYDNKKARGIDFFEFGMKLIWENKYSLVVPVSDICAIYLSKHMGEIPASTKVAVNEWPILRYAIDKGETMKICMESGIPAPKTIFGENLLQQIRVADFTYPVVVKPRTGMGSIGFSIIDSQDKLLKYVEGYDNKNGPILVQEYIKQGKQPQYRADLFRTREGEFKAVCIGRVTRWFPLDGGSGILVQSIHDNKIADNCKKLLDSIGWIGYANIDMVTDDKTGEAKIVEINGRTGASILIDYICGINMSQLMLENEMGLPISEMTEYEDGKMISCFLPDLLWLIKSKDRFRTDPSWFHRRGVKDVIFSWRDPLPSLGFLIESIKGFLPAMKKRKRA